jgi:hypothetical protein
MIFRGIEIKPEWILSVIPATNAIVVRTRLLVLHELAHRVVGDMVVLRLDSDKELQDAKFEHVRHLKGLPNPDARVASFEIEHPEGGIDFKKMERLIEMRKTPDEKNREMQDELELMRKMKDRGIPYQGPLGRV